MFGTISAQDVHVLCLDFAMLLLHINISGQNFLRCYPAFNYCTRFLLFAKWFTLDGTQCYTKWRLHYTNISQELFFLCVIVLGNKAHKTSWNYTFLGCMPNHFWGANFSQTSTQNTRWLHNNTFGNIAMTLWETYVWIFAQFPAQERCWMLNVWGKSDQKSIHLTHLA